MVNTTKQINTINELRNELGLQNIDNKRLRVIMRDWQSVLPDMSPIPGKYDTLYKRIGPLVVCVTFQKKWVGNSAYVPIFYIYNLMLKHDRIYANNFCVDWSDIDYEAIERKYKLNPYSLMYINSHDHELFFKDAAMALKEKTYGLLEDKQFSVNDFILATKKYFLNNRKRLGEELATVCLLQLWVKDFKAFEKTLSWAIEKHHSAVSCNMSFFCNDLVEAIKEYSQHFEKFNDVVQQNLLNFKLTKIPYKDLVKVASH